MAGGGLHYDISYFQCVWQWHCVCSICTILIHPSLLLLLCTHSLPSAGPHLPPDSLPSCLHVTLSYSGCFCTPTVSFLLLQWPYMHTHICAKAMHIHMSPTGHSYVHWSHFSFVCLFLTFWDCFACSFLFEFCWKHSQVKQLHFLKTQTGKWVPPLLLAFLYFLLSLLSLKYSNHLCKHIYVPLA